MMCVCVLLVLNNSTCVSDPFASGGQEPSRGEEREVCERWSENERVSVCVCV